MTATPERGRGRSGSPGCVRPWLLAAAVCLGGSGAAAGASQPAVVPSPKAAARIARHDLDLDVVRRRLPVWDKDIEAVVAAARREVVHSRALRVRAEEYAGYLAASNPSASEICWPVRIGGQAEAAIFAAATAKTPMIDVQIGTARARVRAGIRGIPPDAGSWIAGFHLATLAREKATLDGLARVPLDLLRSPGTTGEDPSLLLAAALQAFWKREDDAPRRLLAALKATDPDRLPPSSRDHAQHILVPEMELLYRVMLQDGGGFNLALSKALEAHKAYWGSPVGGRNQEAAGFLAFGPMAMAALAHEAGMRVEVESDYLLTWLVRGDCHPTR